MRKVWTARNPLQPTVGSVRGHLREDWEFDLKVALAGQNCGPLGKGKLLVLKWDTQLFIDRRYWEGLRGSPLRRF